MRSVKYIICLSLMLLFGSVAVYAQKKIDRESIVQIGIKGGINFSSFDRIKPGEISAGMSSYTGFNTGLAFKFFLPVRGMTIQPELLYVSKGARFINVPKMDVQVGYIEMPVSLQYGFDMIFVRPFLEVTPFIGYAVYEKWNEHSTGVENLFEPRLKDLNRFEYGIGVGGGIDVWRFQLKVDYSWNLGSLVDYKKIKTFTPEQEKFKNAVGKSNFMGLRVSLAFFF